MKRELEQIRKRINNVLSESRCLYMEMASLTCTLEDLEVIKEDPELDEPRTQVSILNNELEVIVDMQNNWEDMEEDTKQAALKKMRDSMKADIQAEKIRQDTLEDEPQFYETHEENDTPRTLYEE